MSKSKKCDHKWVFDYASMMGLETKTPYFSSMLHCENCGFVKEARGGPIQQMKKPMKPAKPSDIPYSIFKR